MTVYEDSGEVVQERQPDDDDDDGTNGSVVADT